MKLNLGAGNSKMSGFKNIDIAACTDPDECYNIENGINEKDGEVEEIFAGCVLEQVDDLTFIMNECHRVLKKGGVLRGYVPSTDPKVMFFDPMDKRFFQEDSFKYFVESENLWQNFGRNYGYKSWSKLETMTNDNGIIHFALTK